jgi:hypothetical protein
VAGYYLYSLDAGVFQQLTTTPTAEQARLLAEATVDELEDLLDEYDEEEYTRKLWPRSASKLTTAIQDRLARPDWYADLKIGDAFIWDTLLYSWMTELGKKLGADMRCENDGMLYWDAPIRAARLGAERMREPLFGNNGFRYHGKSQGDLEFMYSCYLPEEVLALRAELEAVASHFETLPEEPYGERMQFFQGLLEPVRRVAQQGRVLWVQTDT